MSHHPTTFGGESAGEAAIGWDDAATLHHRTNGAGILHGFTALRRGHFADLIRFVANLPAGEGAQYMIERAGDRQYDPYEIVALYQRVDFPRNSGG